MCHTNNYQKLLDFITSYISLPCIADDVMQLKSTGNSGGVGKGKVVGWCCRVFFDTFFGSIVNSGTGSSISEKIFFRLRRDFSLSSTSESKPEVTSAFLSFARAMLYESEKINRSYRWKLKAPKNLSITLKQRYSHQVTSFDSSTAASCDAWRIS